MYSREFLNLTPYIPGEQPRDRRYIKLNTNESPYPPSPSVDALITASDAAVFRKYPDPDCTELRQIIAERENLAPQNVFVGNGSDEVLSFAFYALFDRGGAPLLFPEHSYSFYPVYCDFYGIPYRTIPMEPDFNINLDRYLTQPSEGTIFPNPNAPTGIPFEEGAIENFLTAYPENRAVLIDEAYVDFGNRSSAVFLDRFPNLLVVRTLSKSSALAGLRVGYALGSPDLIRALFVVKDSFNSYSVNTFSQQAACAVLRDVDYNRKLAEKLIATRSNFSASLRELGWRVLPSGANFVFASSPHSSGEVIYKVLREQGILVRFFNKPGISDFVRITIGTDDEMAQLLSAIKKLSSVSADVKRKTCNNKSIDR